jgi:REP element-mobilizing transposase RayT
MVDFGLRKTFAEEIAMTIARKVLVNPTVTPLYHCISRCVRRAFLCGEENSHRKQWIEDRLQELVNYFAIDVCGFSIMDNHLHLLLRLDLARAKAWTAEEVVRRWFLFCPPKDRYGKPVVVTAAWLAERAKDEAWVEERRRRLVDLGWFMKALKENIARRANGEDKCTGHFWEGRFRSVAILDAASLLATCAYIDLNPVAAGLAPTPEASAHTSFKSRIDHCATQGQLDTLKTSSRYASQINVEQGHWLFPIEDRRDQDGHGLAGLLRGISLSGYVQLVDWSSRLIRPGKVNLSADIPDILTRLNIDAESWKETLQRLLGPTKKIGSYFGGAARLSEVAAQRGCKFIKNITGRDIHPATPNAS